MSDPREKRNTDVNSFNVENDYGRSEDNGSDPNYTETAPENQAEREVPVPPDVEDTNAVEEPPSGDIDDSPTRIAGQ